MRKLWLLGVLAAAAVLPSRQGLAYDGPWCAIINAGSGTISERCSMRSFEMCRAEAQLYGPSSFCRQNGRWPGYWAAGGGPSRKIHKSKRRH